MRARRRRRRRSTPYSPLSCSSCPPTSVRLSLPLLSSVLLPATPPASPLPVSEKESGGHETGGGATDARWRGETERRDSGHGRAVAVVHYALCHDGMARYLSALAARSLSLPLHLLPMAREEQENGNARKAAKSKRHCTGSMKERMRRLEWTPP